MLVLSRKPHQTVVLELPDGGLITVTIAEVDGRRVRVGIKAPSSVRVLRGEIRDGP